MMPKRGADGEWAAPCNDTRRRLGNNAAMPAASTSPVPRIGAADVVLAPFAVVGRAPGAFGMVVLAGVALLGNGLKSVVSSSVLVSEAQFATFLMLSPEHIAVLMESVIAGMVVALAACPLLLQRMSAWALACSACVVAAAAFATFALVELSGPAPWMREVAAFSCFALGAGALALLAPASQALVAVAPMPATRTTLIAVWTGAAPAGFLVAPQLVKYLLPAFGLGYYFLAFSALPLVLLALLGALAMALPSARAAGTAAPTFPARLLAAFVAVVVAFEIWTTIGSVTSYATTAAVAGMLGCAVAVAWLTHEVRGFSFPSSLAGTSGWLLLALFALEMPTTGFFDTAYLVQQRYPQSFIADRSSLAAAAQIVGTLAAGILVHRKPAAESVLLYGFATTAMAGLAAIAAYPWIDHRLYFLWTPAIEGFGAAGLTVLVCLAVLRDAVRHPILAALPSIAIMLGTEFGLELLQAVFAGAQAAGTSDEGAYGLLFIAQVVFALVVLVLLWVARQRGRQASIS